MVAYTIVVLVAVVVLTALVFGMDLAFAKGVLRVFGQG
jgi:preprotein translocase subunit SecE